LFSSPLSCFKLLKHPYSPLALHVFPIFILPFHSKLAVLGQVENSSYPYHLFHHSSFHPFYLEGSPVERLIVGEEQGYLVAVLLKEGCPLLEVF
jgi:hypothetical protein